MFYSKFMFVKKGALAKMWLAAHGQRLKISKSNIIQTSITDSVESIVNPVAGPLALRLSGQLLLGLVRIYQRKVRYLQDDATEALSKMKTTFRAGAAKVDLPAEAGVASVNAITLPDDLDALGLDSFPAFDLDLDATQFHTQDSKESIEMPRGAQRMEQDLLPELMDQPIPDDDLDQLLKAAGASELDIDILPIEDFMDEKGPSADELPAVSAAGVEDGMEMPDRDVSMGIEDILPPDIDQHDEAMIDVGAVDVSVAASPAAAAPADESIVEPARKKRRRKVAIVAPDEETEIDKKTLKTNMEDTSDLVRDVDAALKEAMSRPADRPSIDLNMFERPSLVIGAVSADLLMPFSRFAKKATTFSSSRHREEEEDKEHPVDMEAELVGAEAPGAVGDGMEAVDRGDFQLLDDELAAAAPAEPVEPAIEEEPVDVGPPGASDSIFLEESSKDEKALRHAGFSVRTQRFHEVLRETLDESKSDSVSFAELIRDSNNPRRTAAGIFYELLVLKSHDYISVKQGEPYADITISRAAKFDVPLPEMSAEAEADSEMEA